MQPEVSLVEYVAFLSNQGFEPQDFGLNTWEQGVRALRRFVREGIVDPRFSLIVQSFREFLDASGREVQAARSTSQPAVLGGTLYIATERGTRVINVLSNRPDLADDFGIRQNDLIALFTIAENPGMSEEDLEVSNPRGAIIALRQRGLIEPV